MPDNANATTATGWNNSQGLSYPLTKMNFVVNVSVINSTAAFSEATGMEATVDVIEFRQGNSGYFSPVKVPGLVKHGNVTLKYGFTKDDTFRDWAAACTSDKRDIAMPRHDVTIEILDHNDGINAGNILQSNTNTTMQYILRDAWIAKYTAPDMNAMQSEIAIETCEIAFERLEIPAVAQGGGGGEA